MMPATCDRVRQVGLARLPALSTVHLRREVVGALEDVEGSCGVVGANLVEQIAEGHLPSLAKRARARSTMACAISSGVPRSVSITRSYRARSW